MSTNAKKWAENAEIKKSLYSNKCYAFSYHLQKNIASAANVPVTAAVIIKT